MFPKVVQDTTPQSYPDGHLGEGFLAACLPFALGSTITMATNALDLLSDWLAYRAFKNLELPWRVQQLARHNETKDAVWGWDELYQRLPDVFFYFMILATVVFVVGLVRFSYMFAAQRKEFKEKRDGVPYKKSFTEKCGGEAVIILHVCFEDLPVSLVLLAVQVAVSCQMFIPFQDKIYLLCMGTTCFSLCWKVLQVVWNAGCLGQREEYHSGYAITALRIVTLILILGTLGVATLNLLLFPALSSNFKDRSVSNSILDKVGIRRWTNNDHVVMMQGEQLARLYNESDAIPGWHLETNSSLYTYVNLMRLDDIIYNEGNHSLVTLSCDSNSTLYDFVQPAHKDYVDCSADFAFQYNSFQETIHYNYAYRVYAGDKCIMGKFRDHVPLVEAVSPTIVGLAEQRNMEGRNLTHVISMSPLTSSNWVKCSFDLVFNESIPLDLCP